MLRGMDERGPLGLRSAQYPHVYEVRWDGRAWSAGTSGQALVLVRGVLPSAVRDEKAGVLEAYLRRTAEGVAWRRARPGFREECLRRALEDRPDDEGIVAVRVPGCHRAFDARLVSRALMVFSAGVTTCATAPTKAAGGAEAAVLWLSTAAFDARREEVALVVSLKEGHDGPTVPL